DCAKSLPRSRNTPAKPPVPAHPAEAPASPDAPQASPVRPQSARHEWVPESIPQPRADRAWLTGPSPRAAAANSHPTNVPESREPSETHPAHKSSSSTALPVPATLSTRADVPQAPKDSIDSCGAPQPKPPFPVLMPDQNRGESHYLIGRLRPAP